MATVSPVGVRARELIGRGRERELLDRLLAEVRAGESRALVICGEPGIGKSTLLEYVAEQAVGFRVARAAAVQSEMELAFAGLHQLLAPMLDRLDGLPAPQRDALTTAFGARAGPVPDRFFVGLAVLSLLADVAEEEPLICLVDDQQWLDRASAQVLAFVARRLGAESVGLVFTTRMAGDLLEGLPELVVEGLPERDGRALLDSLLTAPLDGRVRDQIVAETSGNPLALIELIRELTPAQLAGGFGLVAGTPLSTSIEDSFRRRLEALPADTVRLLQLAAADPVGDPVPGFRPPTEESFAYVVGPEGALYVGSPETVADKIVANLTLLEASRFDLKFGMPGLTHDQLMTTIELYGTQVMPRVRELVGDDPIAAQPITKPSPAVQSREASEG